jgi:hypothetical protein
MLSCGNDIGINDTGMIQSPTVRVRCSKAEGCPPQRHSHYGLHKPCSSRCPQLTTKRNSALIPGAPITPGLQHLMPWRANGAATRMCPGRSRCYRLRFNVSEGSSPNSSRYSRAKWPRLANPQANAVLVIVVSASGLPNLYRAR